MRRSLDRTCAPGSATRVGAGNDGINADADDDDDDDDDDVESNGGGVYNAVKLVMEEMTDEGDVTSDRCGDDDASERRKSRPRPLEPCCCCCCC